MHTTRTALLGGLWLISGAVLSACGDGPDSPASGDATFVVAADAAIGAPRDAALSRDAAVERADAAAEAGDSDGAVRPPPTAPRLPPANASFDYQIGGAYPPRTEVAVVSRDRLQAPAPGLYNICYVNAFQTQPEDKDSWLKEHAQLVLRDDAGQPVIDPDWNEMLLDIRTPESRAGLLEVVGRWIEGCARAGYAAVEIDNLDTYARSGNRISEAQAVLFMRMLADTAHASGLAIAQKNAAELLDRRAALGTDFAVVEECDRYDECGDFTAAYGDLVFAIEYRRADFDKGCKAFPGLSIVLRDRDVGTPTSKAYVYDGC